MSSLKAYGIIYFIITVVILALYFIAEALNIVFLEDPSSLIQQHSAYAALVSVLLLTSDVVLPIPSSLVMVLNGAVFGAALGFLISLIGSVCSFLLAFSLGRKGIPLIERLVKIEEKRQADELLEKWGILTIVITRPIPVLAETTAIVAGISNLRLAKAVFAALLGIIPVGLLYALTGAATVSFSNLVITFGLIILLAGVFWALGYWLRNNRF